LREPSYVAIDHRSGRVFEIGKKAAAMMGRAPDYIEVVRPLSGGVISDYQMTEVLIKHFLRRICNTQLLRPRVALCVPSIITNVESQAVVDAAVAAGARKVFLIEEPVAAAIGAGLDISKPLGNMVLDVGGGSCDMAVMSLNGIVCKASISTAGQAFDDAIIKYLKNNYNLLVGQRSAEQFKVEVCAVDKSCEEITGFVKGRDVITGLPKKVEIRRSETLDMLREPMELIIRETVGVLEKTPPELVGDIRENGMYLTGGSVQLTGFAKRLSDETNVPAHIAENPEECVAIGTARCFSYIGKLDDGIINISTHSH
jgi:rod shape-determining protein MreB